ncbi:endo/exonuclease/phosphatase domain-containing protein, partial [Haematococcus lacustris]
VQQLEQQQVQQQVQQQERLHDKARQGEAHSHNLDGPDLTTGPSPNPWAVDRRYQGAYLPRGGWRRDGCATFWRREKLQYDLEDNVALLLRLAMRSSGGDPAADPDLDHTSTPAQPPQLPQLDQPPLQPPQLVVANTHVCFDPDKGHVKLGQARTLFTAAHELGQPHSCLVVVAGDFNTCPASPLYHFMEQGSLDLMTTQLTALSDLRCR